MRQYADLDESPEWLRAEARKDDAIRHLERFARTRPQYATLCVVKAYRLRRMSGQIGGYSRES